jgi:hypothetical protein
LLSWLSPAKGVGSGHSHSCGARSPNQSVDGQLLVRPLHALQMTASGLITSQRPHLLILSLWFGLPPVNLEWGTQTNMPN